MRCCDQGHHESSLWSWEKSRRLIGTLNIIRSQTGIRYSESVESTELRLSSMKSLIR